MQNPPAFQGVEMAMAGWARACVLWILLLSVLPVWAQTQAASAPSRQGVIQPLELESLGLMALSQSEGMAVFRRPDGRILSLRVGETLPAARAKLALVQGGRVRFDVVDARGARQWVWMSRNPDPEKPALVERVSLTAPPATLSRPKPEWVMVPIKPASAP